MGEARAYRVSFIRKSLLFLKRRGKGVHGVFGIFDDGNGINGL